MIAFGNVQVLALIHRAGMTSACLWIIGSCDNRYRRHLDGQIVSAGLERHVVFHGRVNEMTKENLLARAHVLVMTSVREGWGLAITEASTMGTPAVVYDVPGLRDSTRHGHTGVVCRNRSPAALAEAVTALYSCPDRYAAL